MRSQKSTQQQRLSLVVLQFRSVAASQTHDQSSAHACVPSVVAFSRVSRDQPSFCRTYPVCASLRPLHLVVPLVVHAAVVAVVVVVFSSLLRS